MTGITSWQVDTGLFTELFFTFIYIYTKSAERRKQQLSLFKHESSGGKTIISAVLQHLSCERAQVLRSQYLPYATPLQERRVRISICTNLFSQTDSSCPKIHSTSVGRLEADLNSLSAGSEPWALTPRQDFLPSGPFCYACADWLLLLQLRFNSGTTCFIATQQLDPQQTSKNCVSHSLFYFFFSLACFYPLRKQMEENKLWWPTGISSGTDKHLEPSRAGCRVIQVITLA